MAIPVVAALAGGGKVLGGSAVAGGGGLWAWLEKLLGAGGGGGGIAAMGSKPGAGTMMSGAGPTGGGGMNLGMIGQRFGAPGTPGATNGTPVPQTTMAGAPYQTGVPMSTNSFSPMQGQISAPQQPQQGGGQQGGAQSKTDKLGLWQNMSDRINGFAFGLMQFGQSLGGLHKEGLNGIPRNPIPITPPQSLVNPGTQDLQSVMAAIMAGR